MNKKELNNEIIILAAQYTTENLEGYSGTNMDPYALVSDICFFIEYKKYQEKFIREAHKLIENYADKTL
jgi:hypothetical protein